jgi:SOS response regulatory protein OraA/RecX
VSDRTALTATTRLQSQEKTMEIPKDQILQLLHDRGDHDTAQDAKQQLPDKVDTEQHSDLLEKLGIDPSDLLGNIGKKFGL